MKVAYLTSRYPALSHTFVLREVLGLRARGVEVGTFSVRRAAAADTLGTQAAAEAAQTRWLVPVPWSQWLRAIAWAATTRPGRLGRTFFLAARQPVGLRQRLLWLCYFLEAVLLAWWLVRDGFQHLHCHFGNSGASTGMLAAEVAGLPFSMTCHGSELREPLRLALAQKVARAAFVVCVSWHGKAQLMLLCPPAHWSKLHVVRCGLALPEAAAPPVAQCDPPRVLCVGRLSAEKGHRVLLDALALLRMRQVNVSCVLVGEGPLRTDLEARSAALTLDGGVSFVGGLSVEQVFECYRAADVVVLASFSEGVPVVLIEALALGRPVVATSVGGVPELVRHRDTGLLVPPGNAAALADALQWVLAHPREAANLAANGRRWVQQEFAPDRALDQLVRLLESSVGCPKSPRAYAQATPA